MPRFENPPYYITAYGLAVKRGFKGTLDEWLASLQGEQGAKGDKVELRYLDDKIQWRWIPDAGAPEESAEGETEEAAEETTDGQTDVYAWRDLVDVAGIRGEIIEQTLATAEQAAADAQASATDADAARQQAETAQSAAQTAKQAAEQAAGLSVRYEGQAQAAAKASATSAGEAADSAAAAAESAKSVNAEEIAKAIAAKGDTLYKDPETGKVWLLSGGRIIGEGVEVGSGDGGLAFDSGYVDESNKIHFTLGGADVEGFTPFELPAGTGGGGYGSTMRLTTTLASRSFSILDRAQSCVIPYTWSSTDSTDGSDTGTGFAEWTVAGSRVSLLAVKQGENTFDVRPYLTDGADNTATLKVTDSYGNSRTLTFTISVTSFGLTWNLAETAVHNADAVTIRMTPTGSGEKTVKVSVDGEVVSETTVSTTGRTVSATVPAQSHGAHTVKAWLEVAVEGETLTTEPLTHLGVWLGEGVTDCVVGTLTPEVTVGQYGTAQIRFLVVDPTAETATVELKVEGETVNVLENVGREVQTWAYKARTVGQQTLSVESGTGAADVELTVEGLGYDIKPVTAGLLLDLDPSGHSNSEAGRESFGYRDAEGVNHPLIFSDNFDWIHGGFQTDSDGVTAFVVKRGCTATLDTSLFGSDCRKTGKNIKLIFKSENVRNYDAELMSCMSGGVGITVQAQQATVSSQLETMKVPYYEGRKIEMDVCIESETENSFAYIDLKAVPSCPPVKYGSTDSWAQAAPTELVIGSEEADVWVYRLKEYTSLNKHEVLDNYIADCGDPEEMVARYERNDVYNTDGTISISKLTQKNKELRSIHIRAKRMTTGKKDEVVCDVEIIYVAGGEAHHLIISNAVIKAQGTSSLEYILAALNLDLDCTGATCVITNGLGEVIAEYAMTENSIPVAYFNLKADVASSEGVNNVGIVDEFNEFAPFICAARTADPRVRDGIEGHPCAVFFTNTSGAAIEVGARTVQAGETILYFAGNMNNSKKNFAVFGQDNSRWPKQCSVEIMNNTELPCRFRADIGDDETWKDGNFEFRFPENPTDEMKAAFREMHHWVVSTTRDLATNAAFDVPVTYGGVAYAGDTAAYRAAKFVAEFENYFVKDSAFFFLLKGERHCLTDNRAKNVFPCYEWVEELQDYRWAFRNPYDKDTAEGCDNSGGATFNYGIEDTDIVGSSYAFNAHDSTLWCNIRDLMADELTEYYNRVKGTGVWDAQRIIDKFITYQGATPEAVRIEDMWNKYFTPWINKDASAYSLKCHGTKEYWREQFERYQQVYMDSKYCDVTDRSNAISMRATIDNAAAGNVTLTAYSDMYFVVMYGNGGTAKIRAKRNTPTLIECPTDSLGDTETYIFSASQLTAISSLAALKPKFVIATTAEKLQELIVGSGEVGYENLNLNQIGVGNNTMLELLDVRGAPNLVTALDMSALTSLEEFYANGSGVTGVIFAKGAPLRIARFSAISSLVAQDLTELETFVMDGGNLLSLRVESCPAIDTLAACKAASGLTRGRLTDVSWNDDNADVLLRLATLKGYDAQGEPIDNFVLTGEAHCAAVTQAEIDEIQAAFPDLQLSYDTIVPSYTVTFQNDDGSIFENATQTIREGGYAVNPVSDAETLPADKIRAPTKASTVENDFSFAGWDKALGPITADTVITAKFNATDRFYTVNHWADPAESKLLQTKKIIAHGKAEYAGSDPTGDGLWVGWDTGIEETTGELATDNVVRDLNIHAMFVEPVLPETVPEVYDYLYSNNPDDVSKFTASEFYGILYNGLERVYFTLGDRIKLVCSSDGFADKEIILELRSYKHFLSAERDGFAGPYFGMVGVMNATRGMNSSNTNTGGWPASGMSAFLEEVVCPGLPQFWRALMERIIVHSSVGDTAADIVSKECRLTLESQAEVGFNVDAVPYVNEIADGADEVTLACYTDNASRIKKSYNGTGSASYYWLRSPLSSSTSTWCSVHISGHALSSYASTSNGVAFGFCLRSNIAE